MNTTILALTALVVALGLVVAFTIAIPALEEANNGHMVALAKNDKPKNPNYKGANSQGCGRSCTG